MRHITGAQAPPVAPLMGESGGTFPWEANVGGTNTSNGNKQTTLPLVGWAARGGRLSVNLSLYHSSKSSRDAELGHKWSHSYDIDLTLDSGDVTVHWGDDQSYTFVPDISGVLQPPTGIHDTLTVSGSGTSAVYTLTKTDQTVYTFGYVGGAFHCTSIADRNGNTITINHSSTTGLVTSVVDPSSRTLTFSYRSGRLVSVSDPLSRSWSFSYDSTHDDLTSVAFPTVGSTTYGMTYGYNSAHDITSTTDLRGKVWTAAYNSSDGITSEINPLNYSTTYAYTSTATTITDANSHATVYTYGSSGTLSSITDATSKTESYTYDSAFNKTGVTDKRGKVWASTFDSRGNLLTKTDPLSHTTTWTYNSKNDPLTKTTPLGHVTSYGYDMAGNLTSVTDPLSHGTTLTVNSNGSVTAVTDALSNSTTLTYNSSGDVTVVEDALGHDTAIAYDALGRKTSATDAAGFTTSTSYDALGRVASVTAPGSRTTTYAYAGGTGIVVSETDPLSHTNTYDLDDAGQVTGKEAPDGSQPFAHGHDVENWISSAMKNLSAVRARARSGGQYHVHQQRAELPRWGRRGQFGNALLLVLGPQRDDRSQPRVHDRTGHMDLQRERTGSDQDHGQRHGDVFV